MDTRRAARGKEKWTGPRAGGLGLALELGLPAVLVDEPEGEDEEPGADDGPDGHGDEVVPEGVEEVHAAVDVRAADDDAARDEELVDDEVVEARRDEELDGQPDHDELRDGLGRDHLEPDGEADHPVAARAADERRAEVLRALGLGGLDELADFAVLVAARRAEVAVVEVLLEGRRVLVEDLVVVLERAAAVRVVLAKHRHKKIHRSKAKAKDEETFDWRNKDG